MKLIVRESDRQFEVTLRDGVMTFGRSSKCDVKLQTETMSRKHFECRIAGTVVTVRDLGSSNGLFINGEKMTEAVLRDGDQVKAGQVRFTFKSEAPPGTPAVEAAAATAPAAAGGTAPLGLNFDEMEDAASMRLKEESQPAPREGEVAGLPVLAGANVSVPAPVGPAAVRPAARAPASLLKKLAIAAAMTACSLGVAYLAVIRLGLLQKPPSGEPRMSTPQYERLVDSAIADIEKGDFTAAKRSCKQATLGISTRRTAIALDRVVDMWEASSADFSSMNWTEADERLKELLDSNPTAKVTAFVNTELRRVRKEKTNEVTAGTFEQLVREAKPEKALEEFEKISPESVYRKKLSATAMSLRVSCRTRYMQTAKAAADEGQWDRAIAVCRDAQRYSSANDQEISDVITRCTQAKAYRNKIAEAETLYKTGNAEEAMQILESIPKTSDVRAQADALAQQIRGSKLLNAILAAYRAQNGDAALKMIDSSPNPMEFAPLKQRIAAVMGAWNAGEEALKREQYEVAVAQFGKILTLEDDKQCGYRKLAVQKLTEWSPRRIAEESLKKGLQALYENRYRDAMKLFIDAKSKDPENKLGQEQLDVLRTKAIRLLNEGINLVDSDPVKAVQLFRQVMELVPETDKVYGQAKSRIERLTGSKGG